METYFPRHTAVGEVEVLRCSCLQEARQLWQEALASKDNGYNSEVRGDHVCCDVIMPAV
jgi:hypothetical protein